jgi:hypothetical protein
VKSFLFRIIHLSFLVCFPLGVCFGQSANSYNSATTDGTYIYTGVTVQGTMPPGSPNVCHTYSAYNLLGGVGGWQQNRVCGTGAGSVTNNQQTWAADGHDVSWSGEAKVLCSVAGLFFDQILPSVTFSIKLSSYSFYGMSNGLCAWVPTCAGKCSSQHTTPPASDGLCVAPGWNFKQCFDLVKNGQCWSYRTFCYAKQVAGSCTN